MLDFDRETRGGVATSDRMLDANDVAEWLN